MEVTARCEEVAVWRHPWKNEPVSQIHNIQSQWTTYHLLGTSFTYLRIFVEPTSIWQHDGFRPIAMLNAHIHRSWKAEYSPMPDSGSVCPGPNLVYCVVLPPALADIDLALHSIPCEGKIRRISVKCMYNLLKQKNLFSQWKKKKEKITVHLKITKALETLLSLGFFRQQQLPRLRRRQHPGR